MKTLDWQMVMFVGSTLMHDFWIYWGLPQVYYWEVKKEHLNMINDDNDNNKAA